MRVVWEADYGRADTGTNVCVCLCVCHSAAYLLANESRGGGAGGHRDQSDSPHLALSFRFYILRCAVHARSASQRQYNMRHNGNKH
ncbi:hypothetical protein FKM82_031382 [Ascaphus truei]